MKKKKRSKKSSKQRLTSQQKLWNYLSDLQIKMYNAAEKARVKMEQATDEFKKYVFEDQYNQRMKPVEELGILLNQLRKGSKIGYRLKAKTLERYKHWMNVEYIEGNRGYDIYANQDERFKQMTLTILKDKGYDVYDPKVLEEIFGDLEPEEIYDLYLAENNEEFDYEEYKESIEDFIDDVKLKIKNKELSHNTYRTPQDDLSDLI